MSFLFYNGVGSKRPVRHVGEFKQSGELFERPWACRQAGAQPSEPRHPLQNKRTPFWCPFCFTMGWARKGRFAMWANSNSPVNYLKGRGRVGKRERSRASPVIRSERKDTPTVSFLFYTLMLHSKKRALQIAKHVFNLINIYALFVLF